MSTVLITGANRGLGLEFARQYVADGWDVIACCRDPDGADALKDLGVRVEALDVADEASVEALAERLAGEPIDLLVNNAGTAGGRRGRVFGQVDKANFETTLAVNALGPLLVTQGLAGNLKAAADAKGTAVVAVVSSKMGSMADNGSGGAYVYRASKAAANAIGRSMARDLLDDGILTVILHPGWVRTDMGGPGGLIDAPESVSGLRNVIARASRASAGRFFDYKGEEIPW